MLLPLLTLLTLPTPLMASRNDRQDAERMRAPSLSTLGGDAAR